MRSFLRRRAFGALALVALSSTVFAACGSGDSSDGGDGSLKIHWLSSIQPTEGTVAAIKQIAAEYKKTHPGFELTIESIPSRPDFNQKLKVLAGSDELPEWFDANPEPYFEQLVDAGAVADVEAIYKETGVLDDVYPIALQYPRLDDGRLNIMAWQSNLEHFWFNKDLFAQAGVNAPETFDEFLQACERLKAAGITPIAVDGQDQWPTLRYLSFLPFRHTGNDFIDGLRNGDAKMTDDVGMEAARFFETLGKNYFQKGWASADYNAARDLFVNGKAAIYYIGTWEVPSFTDKQGNLKPQFDRFTLPSAGASDAVPRTDFFAHSGLGTAIRKDADTPAMREWIKYLFSRLGEVAISEYGYLPSVKPQSTEKLSELNQSFLDEIENLDTIAKLWDVRLDPDSVDVLARESTNLGIGRATAEQFAERVQAALENSQASQ